MKKNSLLFILLFLAAGFVITGQEKLPSHSDEYGSLTVDEFMELGISSPYRFWNGDDYLIAVDVLTDLKSRNPDALPRMYDPGSSALFRRIADIDNYHFLNDTLYGMDYKTRELEKFSQYYEKILFLFITDTEVQVYGSEVLELFIFGLEFQKITIRLISDITGNEPEIPTNEEDGLADLRAGLAQSLGGSMTTLELTQSYGTEDLKAFSRRLKDLVIEFWPWLIPADRESFSEKIAILSETHDIPAVRKDMLLLIRKLGL